MSSSEVSIGLSSAGATDVFINGIVSTAPCAGSARADEDVSSSL